MKIAYLTSAGSMHINIKAKYFSKEDYIHFFAIQLCQRTEPKIKYHNNMDVTFLQHQDDWKSVLKNAVQIKKIIRKHHIQIVHVIEMTFVEYALALSISGVKVVIENNGSDVILGPDSAFRKKEYKYAYRLCKAVVQDSLLSQKAGIALGAPQKNNLVIELGVDTDIFNLSVPSGEFRKKYGIPQDAKIIFSPRAFTPLYNIKQIIATMDDILEKHPDTYYVFCTYRKNKKYENMIKKRTRNAIFLGYIDNEQEMPYLYRDADIVLSIPSSDSSPRTVYEAMACGCNTIVSNLPWVTLKFEDGKDLFTVDPHDSKQLIQTISDILDKKVFVDQEKVFNKICRILDYKISAKQLKELYQQII